MIPLRLHGHTIALRLPFRHVDVEKRARRQRLPQDRVGHHRRGARRVAEIVVAARLPQRHADAGNAEQRAFERAGDGPRIGDVVAEVPSLVDAGDDEIGQAVEDVRDGDVDAVGRRAVDGEDAIVDRLEPQRPPQRQRVADRARLGRRRDDRHVAELASASASA